MNDADDRATVQDLVAKGWVGKVLGKYKLIEMIASGTTSRVFRAHETVTQETVAVKIFDQKPASDVQDNYHFMREVRTLKSLKKGAYPPHIVRIIDYDTAPNLRPDEELPYIVMELMGMTVAKSYSLNKGAEGQEKTLRYIQDSMTGALEGHQRKLFHRDIHGNNMLITPDGSEAKLSDFGNAKFFDGQSYKRLEQYPGGNHSVYYVPPEISALRDNAAIRQFLDSINNSGLEAWDIFQLGMTISHLIYGIPGSTEISHDLRKHKGMAPPELSDLTIAMTSREPEDRGNLEAHIQTLGSILKKGYLHSPQEDSEYMKIVNEALSGMKTTVEKGKIKSKGVLNSDAVKSLVERYKAAVSKLESTRWKVSDPSLDKLLRITLDQELEAYTRIIKPVVEAIGDNGEIKPGDIEKIKELISPSSVWENYLGGQVVVGNDHKVRVVRQSTG